jgi:TPP-dependent pyruvate/acetoin dehydrogenase alpha subunit
LAWEAEFDCVAQMKKWMIENNIATSEELEEIDNQALKKKF